MKYRAYGRTLESDRPLPELEPVEAGHTDLRLAWDAVVRAPAGLNWTTLWRFSDGEPWVTSAREGAAHHFRFGRFAEFRVSPMLIEMAPRGRVADTTLRHLLLDQALPLALASTGALVLHASAVLLGSRAVLFVGSAGAGKSTMAAVLARSGTPVLADDGVLIRERDDGGLEAVPSYPGLRLLPDASAATALDAPPARGGVASRKRRVVASAQPGLFRSTPAPVGRVYLLAEGPDVEMQRITRRDAAIAVVRHAYRPGTDDRAGLRQQLDTIARCTSGLDVWTLRRPRDFSRMAEVAERVAAHAAVG